MPTSLHCPNCGASARADDSRCVYCGSVLAVTSCPSCFAAMFVGMQFCPNCGAKGSREMFEEKTPLGCPGCKNTMQLARVGVTMMHECATCGSTWLDAETFRGLCLNREERGAVVALIGQGAAQKPGEVAGQTPRYVPCPLCTKIMNRVNFGRRSGIVIDICRSDGVWFERGELRRVLAFIDSGGLEHARAADQEQQAEAQRARAFLDSPLMSDAPRPSPMDEGDGESFAGWLVREALSKLFS